MNIAIILAGGVGSRYSKGFPKQFFKVAGKTVLEHTVDAFEKETLIDEIAIVMNSSYLMQTEEMVLTNGWRKVRKILNGGKERYTSSITAIKAYQSLEGVNLIFHDAVRPLVSGRIIKDVIEALETYNAVDVAIPATDTIISVDGAFIESIPDRSKLRRGQTPQGFKLETILEAYNLALQDPDFKTTDDCGVVLKYLPQEKIYVVNGDESNMKLTHKEDSFLLDKLFQLRSLELNSSDIPFEQLANKVVVIFGGSSGIGEQMASIARKYGANVYSFSRSQNNIDISKQNDVRDALSSVAAKELQIDFVVNTAAILSKSPLLNMDYQSISSMINTNYLGMVNIALESFLYLKQSKGHLLFYTSSAYTRGRAFYSIYSSTKAAVVNFVQAIAQEWESAQIRINCICPERTDTPMRTRNFGIEDHRTLLTSDTVAYKSLQTMLSDYTGQVVDVRLND